MDQGALVDDQIEDGQRFLNLLVDDGVDVTAAAWAKTLEDERWVLYVASKIVDEQGLAAAYRAAHPAIQRLRNPQLTFFQLKLINATGPIAQDILNAQVNYGDSTPRRFRGPILGNVAVDEVYVYPRVSTPEERWRGISVMAFPEAASQNTYRVEFWPRQLQAEIGMGGQPRRVPRPASVTLHGGCITEFSPPEQPMPFLSQGDYEQKALEAVQKLSTEFSRPT